MLIIVTPVPGENRGEKKIGEKIKDMNRGRKGIEGEEERGEERQMEDILWDMGEIEVKKDEIGN